jgi:hypothetical protein
VSSHAGLAATKRAADGSCQRVLTRMVDAVSTAMPVIRSFSATSFKAHKRIGPNHHTPVFDFSRQSVAVNHYYFYVHDREWGPAFLKIGTYLPYPVKLCLNGHEWVKRHLRRDRIRFESLDNGFLSCPDAAALQATCDALGPSDVQAFFDRWSHRLPWPMTLAERAAGYDHRLAICQLEISLTQVFDRPV